MYACPSPSLHSHDVFFGRGGVLSVTGYPFDDLGSFWQVHQPYKIKKHAYRDVVRCGDTIALSSAIVGYFLRLEETQFGLTTELLPMVHGMPADRVDDKINWQIQCTTKGEGEQLHYQDTLRLVHSATGKLVSLDQGYAYTEANCGRGCSIAGQIELHGIDAHDDTTTVFQVKTGLTFDQGSIEQ